MMLNKGQKNMDDCEALAVLIICYLRQYFHTALSHCNLRL